MSSDLSCRHRSSIKTSGRLASVIRRTSEPAIIAIKVIWRSRTCKTAARCRESARDTTCCRNRARAEWRTPRRYLSSAIRRLRRSFSLPLVLCCCASQSRASLLVLLSRDACSKQYRTAAYSGAIIGARSGQ